MKAAFRREAEEGKEKGVKVGEVAGACEVLGLAERCVAALAAVGRDDVVVAALAAVGRDNVGQWEKAAAPGRGTKQVEGWGKDVARARKRQYQDNLCRRWCVGGGGIVSYVGSKGLFCEIGVGGER